MKRGMGEYFHVGAQEIRKQRFRAYASVPVCSSEFIFRENDHRNGILSEKHDFTEQVRKVGTSTCWMVL